MKLPPMDPWASGVRAADVPIVNGGDPNPLENADVPPVVEESDPSPPAPGAPMVEFALYYARRGWPVFPCKPTNKAPYFTGGFHAATTDEETIRRWWGYWPKAMIGVPMGPRSGVWAVDPDPPKKPEEPDGREIWAGLIRGARRATSNAHRGNAARRAAYRVQMGPGPASDQQPRCFGKDEYRCQRRRRLHRRGAVRLRW